MQAGGPDSAAVSEAPSSGSEESDCETQPEHDADAALTEEWACELLLGDGVTGANEVNVHCILLIIMTCLINLFSLIS